MNDPRPERVRVTGPPRRTRPRAARAGALDTHEDLHDETALGAVYLRSLLREQGRLALRVVGLLVLTVGSLPVLFAVAPQLAGVRVLGVALPWVLLGLVVYPWLVVLGWRYVRRAERNERDFTDLLGGRRG